MRHAAAVAAALALTACGGDDPSALPACPMPRTSPPTFVAEETTTRLDLLFVMDNSNSTLEYQALLAAELPRMLEALVARGIRSMQVGVVTSDMGTGGFGIPTCVEPNFGDDGVLRTAGNTTIPGCMARYPKFLTFTATREPAIDVLAWDASCVMAVGSGGCGFEQHLEAMLKAVTSPTEPASGAFDGLFARDTRGHAGPGGANEGFVRYDAALAVVVVADEDDCSARDPTFFDPMGEGGDLNVRCVTRAEDLQPIERYADGLVAAKRDARRVVFAAAGGVPPDLFAGDAAPTLAEILADPRMLASIDPERPGSLIPTCRPEGRPATFPPERIAKAAGALEARGAHAVVDTLCDVDLARFVDRTVEAIGRATVDILLTGDATPNAAGLYEECRLLESDADGSTTGCAALPGRTVVTSASGAEVCALAQLPAGSAPAPSEIGWYVATEADGARVLRFTEGERDAPLLGWLECDPDPTDDALGTDCVSDQQCIAGLVCDRATWTCQTSCHETGLCPRDQTCDLDRVCRDPGC